MKRLTPTSYAVLGLLAVESHSPYDLIQHMKRGSLAILWPRAESKLYEEPKHLVAHGLATATPDPDGGRRTVYSITDAGRQALTDWLTQPGGPLRLEFETMVQVGLTDLATLDDLRALILHMRDWVRAEIEAHRALLEVWLDTGPRFPERLHVSGLTLHFIFLTRKAVLDWTDWALEHIDQWADTEFDPRKERQAKELVAALLAAMERAAARIG